MNTNDNKEAAKVLAAAPAGGYVLTAGTQKLLDCMRAGSTYYSMIADALQERYAGILSPAEAEAKAQQYLSAIEDIQDMLQDEVRTCIADALMDTANTTADTIRI